MKKLSIFHFRAKTLFYKNVSEHHVTLYSCFYSSVEKNWPKQACGCRNFTINLGVEVKTLLDFKSLSQKFCCRQNHAQLSIWAIAHPWPLQLRSWDKGVKNSANSPKKVLYAENRTKVKI